MSKKVLIVTYYWPPSGGSGVQRWLKFVKYLPQFGWTPYVITPENPAFELRDESLLKDVPPEAEVLKLPIWEPYRLLPGKKSKDGRGVTTIFPSAGNSLTQKTINFIRGNFLIPDPRVFWVRPAVRFLEDLILHEKISHIVTTGPPHSMHLIGLRLKKKIPSIKWIADFRDPWSEWHLLDELRTTRLVKSIHRHQEIKVLRQADLPLTVTPYLAKRFSELSGRKVVCITNGYDESDLAEINYQRTNRFTIRHVGLLRNAGPFIEAVRKAMAAEGDLETLLRIEFIGLVDAHFRNMVQQDETISKLISFVPYVLHDQLKAIYGKTDVLLLVIPDVMLAKGYLPGKIFEYLASGRPVIGLGPEDGDAAELLKQSGAGIMCDWKNIDGLSSVLLDYFRRWKQGDSLSTSGAPNYKRKNLTASLADLLNAL